MKQAIQFMFDNVSSESMGVFIAWNSSGLFEEVFLPERSIIEKKVPNRAKPYFFGVDEDPLSFPVTIVIQDFTEDKRRRVARWLFKNYYKPLVFDSDPNRYFQAILEGSSELIHNGAEGYIEVNVRCDSPYGYSFEKTRENIPMRDANSNEAIEVKLDSSNFNLGTFNGTIETTNGVTIDSIKTTWGGLPSEKWGELD